MKVGLVCPYNIFRGGGVQEVVLALQSELSARGHNVKIITPLHRNHKDSKAENTIFIGISADFKSLFNTTAQVSVSLNTDGIEDMLAQEKFDILNFHEPWVPIMSRQLLVRSQAKNIATFHAKLPETAVTHTIERVITPYTKSIMKYLDELTAVSDAAAEYVQSLTTRNINIVPNGIDLNKYKKTAHKDQSETRSILFIGRLEKRKGVKYLIKAFALLQEKSPGVELTIAGDGPDRIKLETYVLNHGINNVNFVGFVSESEKLHLLSRAALFCSPALYGESFGIVLLEALASGVVTVAGDNPGYSSVMKDIGTISLVNPKDGKEFARRLDLLIGNQALRQEWRKWAADYVKQFDYKIVAKQYE